MGSDLIEDFHGFDQGHDLLMLDDITNLNERRQVWRRRPVKNPCKRCDNGNATIFFRSRVVGSFRSRLTTLGLLLGSESRFPLLWLPLNNDLSSVLSQFYLTNRTILQNVCKVFYALNQGCLRLWFVFLLIHKKFYLTVSRNSDKSATALKFRRQAAWAELRWPLSLGQRLSGILFCQC